MSKLKELGEVLNGSSIPKKRGEYPAYGGNGIIDYVDKYNYPENTIIIGRVGANCGAIHFSENKCWVTDNALAFKVTKEVEPYFAYCLLKMLDLNKFHIGSSQPLITQSIINSIEYKYIRDTEKQIKIAHCIKLINDKIENNNKINAELESMAKTIYDYWFLQFDFPDENGKPYKSSGGKMVWNEELKREIPEGWDMGTFSDLGEIVAGGTPSTTHPEYYTEDGIPWITPNDLANISNKYISHGERDITELGLNNSSAKLIPKGSVLLTSRAPIGYLGIATNEVSTNQGFKSIIPNKKYKSEFVYYTVLNMVPYLKSLGTGSTFTEISKGIVSKVKTVLPNEEIVKKFNDIATDLGKRREKAEQENQELASLRDFLLPLLMNGQVGFKDLESVRAKEISLSKEDQLV